MRSQGGYGLRPGSGIFMKQVDGAYRLTSGDLTGYLACRHLTQLELQVAAGAMERPKSYSASLEALWERGFRHEQEYVRRLETTASTVARIEGVEVDNIAIEATLGAMRGGADVIVQAGLRAAAWVGRADVLRRVTKPSALGEWSYEVYDTKLSRATKSSTILQLCLYSDMLGTMQGIAPEEMHVVAPWTDFVPQSFRVAEYSAYYRLVRRNLDDTLAAEGPVKTYPVPTPHCDICAWRAPCLEKRRADDHLSLVAGISSMQINELEERGVASLTALAKLPLPLAWKPERGSQLSYHRIREQARLQQESRDAGSIRFERIVAEEGHGLSALSQPDPADLYLDFEGDPFAAEHGQEYLLGYHYLDYDGESRYSALWGLTRDDEKKAFEEFIDFAIERWARHPGLHIYHYGGYEAGALKRLMGRYATREDELDRILRGKLLVDLLTIVRQGVRVGVESYSIKRLEPVYGYERDTALPDANVALTRLQTGLELGDLEDISKEDRGTVESYNRDDCVSTRQLHIWLEEQREAMITDGVELQRPLPGDGTPGENVSEWVNRITPLTEALTHDVPVDPTERTPEQHGRWLLANLLDFHRREDKATWWEYFRLAALPAEELIDEKAGLGGLAFVATVGGTARCPVQRYTFVVQETEARSGKSLHSTGGEKFGEVEAIDAEAMTVDIRKRKDTASFHPDAAFIHEVVASKPMMEALARLAEFVIAYGLSSDGPYRAECDLLLRRKPDFLQDGRIQRSNESAFDAALRLTREMGPGVLPIQGPPGAGKTFTGAQMIVRLAARGKRIGVVANSHAVIRNLIDTVNRVATEEGAELRCVVKVQDDDAGNDQLRMAKNNDELFGALARECQVAGATAWVWSLPEAMGSVDVLFVDEAAQMSLANVLAASQAARAVVLLGDPRQLDQPMKGSHPEGTDRSALDHLLNAKKTIAPDQGLFLDETWRLHPTICKFTSELFYEDKLHARPGLERQRIVGGPASGSGLRFIPVHHVGNTNCSIEEAKIVGDLVDRILAERSTWITSSGDERPVQLTDILIITPYNAQVYELKRRLPGARVGTVDKFQGQEAPIAIYSLATSSHAEAPRGMEFLYSLNRLNVATSRARCISFLVCSRQIFQAECRNPRQMQLANAFCRYLELTADDPSVSNVQGAGKLRKTEMPRNRDRSHEELGTGIVIMDFHDVPRTKGS